VTPVTASLSPLGHRQLGGGHRALRWPVTTAFARQVTSRRRRSRVGDPLGHRPHAPSAALFSSTSLSRKRPTSSHPALLRARRPMCFGATLHLPLARTPSPPSRWRPTRSSSPPNFSHTNAPHFSPPCLFYLERTTSHVPWCRAASPACRDANTALTVVPRPIVFSHQLLSHECPTFLPTLSFLPRTHDIPCATAQCSVFCSPGCHVSDTLKPQVCPQPFRHPRSAHSLTTPQCREPVAQLLEGFSHSPGCQVFNQPF
jgi:hypothetical protein